MKKSFISFALLLAFTAQSFAAMPNDKVLKSFASTFVSPKNVKWYEHADFCEVSFVQDNIRTSVKYDLDGNFLSSIRYYKEQQLPTNLLSKLRKKYADKKIFGITELTNNDSLVYFVKMEDDKHWLTIKLTAGGQMEQIEKYRRA